MIQCRRGSWQGRCLDALQLGPRQDPLRHWITSRRFYQPWPTHSHSPQGSTLRLQDGNIPHHLNYHLHNHSFPSICTHHSFPFLWSVLFSSKTASPACLPACLFLFLFIFLFLFSTVLQLFLSSSKSALRFAAMRTLSEVAVRQPVRWASSTPHALLSPVSIWYRHLYIYWYLLFVHQHSLFYLSLLALLCTFLVYPIASHPFIHQSKVGQVESFWSHLRSADRHFLPYRRCNLSPSTSTSLYLNPCHPPYFSSYSYSCLLLSFFFSTVLTIILDHHVSLLLSLFPFLHYLRYCICIVQSHPVCPSAMMTWKDLSLTRTDPSPHSPSQPFSK